MVTVHAHAHALVVSDHDYKVLAEALEIHVEGLKSAKREATLDRTLEEPEDLLTVASSLDADIAAGEKMLKELFHVSS